MKPIYVLWGLLFCMGCSSDGAKEMWEPFWKDLRGDNMKMSSEISATK